MSLAPIKHPHIQSPTIAGILVELRLGYERIKSARRHVIFLNYAFDWHEA